jgi:hypothetical protein
MYIHEQIENYDVSYFAGGKNVIAYEYRAIIGLRRADYSLIGAAYFYRNPDTMPDADQFDTNNGQIYAHYRWEDFPMVLDLLRNEKPVYFVYTGESWGSAYIATSMMEPVGEGEIQAP